MILEARLERPELAAAPRRGASQAAFEAAFTTEAATAKGQVAATSAVDMSKFFEYVQVSEYAAAALRVGIPRQIVALTAHFYTGARRLRVQKAYSVPLFPRRSIVAGCTWCTVFIRVLMLNPIDHLRQQLRAWSRAWSVNFLLRIYIDDGMLTTYGCSNSVGLMHVWATQYLLEWIRNVLRKMVAVPKLQCITADGNLRKILRAALAPAGFRICKLGEMLGSDYAAGGTLSRRKLQDQRRRKARKRKGRLKWWAQQGGNSAHVVDTGVAASISYCRTVNGITPTVMHDMRRFRGARTRVKCGGTSLSTKLAIAGPRYCDADPATVFAAPPFLSLLELLWDFPQTRFHLVLAWRGAHRDMDDVADSEAWKRVRGPVGAALCHLRQIDVRWDAPFRITFDGVTINILETSPRHTYAVLQDRARVQLDKAVITKLAERRGWNAESILPRYRLGIDWDFVRNLLRSPALTPTQRRGLQVLISGGFWSDERKWLNGYLNNPGCTVCGEAVGDDAHYFRGDCPAVQVELNWERIAGRASPTPAAFDDAALAPLTEMLLPPRLTAWRPIPESAPQGYLEMNSGVNTYGDGSGYRQQVRDSRVSTWAVIRLDDEGRPEQILRGAVPGFFPTVPRAELTALREHLRHAGPQAAYYGDCQHVLDIARQGVGPWFTSARSPNADLWRQVRWLLDDHGSTMPMHKVKAHRSRQAAILDGDLEQTWLGNQMADKACKELARDIARADDAPTLQAAARAEYRAVALRQATVMKWAFRARPQCARGHRQKGARTAACNTSGQHRVSPHRIVASAAGRWHCSSCRREAWTEESLRRLRTTNCAGPMAATCHYTHSLTTQRGILWCTRCGAYTTRQPRALKDRCPMKPASAAAATILRRLRRGLNPTTAGYLERADVCALQAINPYWHPHFSETRSAAPPPMSQSSTSSETQTTGIPSGLAHADWPQTRDAGEPGSAPRLRPPVHQHGSAAASRYLELDRRRQRREGAGPAEAPAQSTDASGTALPRRRLTGKQPPSTAALRQDERAASEAAAAAAAAEARRAHCTPQAEQPWTARIDIECTAVARPCAICEQPCRGRCVGCRQSLCIACARAGPAWAMVPLFLIIAIVAITSPIISLRARRLPLKTYLCTAITLWVLAVKLPSQRCHPISRAPRMDEVTPLSAPLSLLLLPTAVF